MNTMTYSKTFKLYGTEDSFTITSKELNHKLNLYTLSMKTCCVSAKAPINAITYVYNENDYSKLLAVIA